MLPNFFQGRKVASMCSMFLKGAHNLIGDMYAGRCGRLWSIKRTGQFFIISFINWKGLFLPIYFCDLVMCAHQDKIVSMSIL